MFLLFITGLPPVAMKHEFKVSPHKFIRAYHYKVKE